MKAKVLAFGKLSSSAPAAAWRARWASARRQAAVQWRALSGRERRLVGVAAIALALGGLWLLGVEPALRQVVRWEAEIPKLRSQAQALEQVLAEVPPAPAVSTARAMGAPSTRGTNDPNRPNSAASPNSDANPNSDASPDSLSVAAVRADLDAAGLPAEVQAVASPDEQATAVQITFESVPVGRLMPWLMAGPARSGLAVVDAELARDETAASPAEPTLSGQLRLAAPNSSKDGS